MVFALIACTVCEAKTNYVLCSWISQYRAPLAQAELWTQYHLPGSVRWGVRREQRERAGSILTASLLCYFCFPAPGDQKRVIHREHGLRQNPVESQPCVYTRAEGT